MFGRVMTVAAALLVAVGVGNAGVAAAHPVPVTGSDAGGQTIGGSLDPLLRDADRHVGEKYPVYGLVYSDAAVWTLAFVSGTPTDYYTIDGSRVELARPVATPIAQGDVFTGTMTITGKSDSGDPLVALDNVAVIGHRPGEALR